MSPQFKPVHTANSNDGIPLNSQELFWVEFTASHISFKKGRVSFWLLDRGDSPLDDEEKNYNTHRSTRNRTFIRKKGNCFTLGNFRILFDGGSHRYGPIEWDWKCRKCLKSVPRVEIMNSKEECSECQKKTLKTRLVPY